MVYPTAVLLRPEDLRSAQKLLATQAASVVMSVGRFRAPIERAWRIDASGRGRMAHPEHEKTRTQDLPESFFDAGQFYFAIAEFWRAGGSLVDAQPTLFPLPSWRALDVDTIDDLEAVERQLLTLEPEAQR